MSHILATHLRYDSEGRCLTAPATWRHIWSPWCCEKTGAEVVLFTMVDASMRHKAAIARTSCGLSPAAEARWVKRLAQVGWWRSCWPV